MSQPLSSRLHHHEDWQWPLNLAAYDQSPVLSDQERAEIERRLHDPHGQLHKRTKTVLRRLLLPLYDALELVHARRMARYGTIRAMLMEMHRRGTPYWAWSAEEWAESICSDATAFGKRYGWTSQKWNRHPARGQLPLLAYLFGTFPASEMGRFADLVKVVPLARKVFGRELIENAVQQLLTILQGWGYQRQDRFALATCVCYLFLRNRSPYLSTLSFPLLKAVDESCPFPSVTRTLFQVSRALVALGCIDQSFPEQREIPWVSGTDGTVDDEWLSWCQRWLKHATQQQTKKTYYYILLKVGRWLKVNHPEIKSPTQWTTELAAEFVAAVGEMKVGDWSDASRRTRLPADRLNQPLRPQTKAGILQAIRVFLRDCQEWQWIPVRLNPLRTLRTPRSIGNLIGPDPRVIDKVLWAIICTRTP